MCSLPVSAIDRKGGLTNPHKLQELPVRGNPAHLMNPPLGNLWPQLVSPAARVRSAARWTSSFVKPAQAPEHFGGHSLASDMSLQSGSALGPCEVIELIGAGGRGEVYRARDVRRGRGVVVKNMRAGALDDEDCKRRLMTEARLAESLSHSPVAKIYNIGERDGFQYLVMELVEGTCLEAKLVVGSLPIPETLTIASALAEVHRGGASPAGDIPRHQAREHHRDADAAPEGARLRDRQARRERRGRREPERLPHRRARGHHVVGDGALALRSALEPGCQPTKASGGCKCPSGPGPPGRGASLAWSPVVA